jgi:hypothetical protein
VVGCGEFVCIVFWGRRLSQLGVAATGIEEVKLRKHIEYCSDAVTKAEILSRNTAKEAEAEQKKLRSQQLALESQKMEAEVARTIARQKELQEKADRERKAKEAEERMDRLREQWQEQHQVGVLARLLLTVALGCASS